MCRFSTAFGLSFLLVLGSVQGQEPTPLEKLDPKKLPVTLRPKGTPAEVLVVLGERSGRYDGHALRADGTALAVAGLDGVIRIWDLTTLKVATTIGQPEVVSLTFSASGKSLITGDASGVLRIWPLGPGKRPPLATIPAHKDGPIWAMTLTPDGSMLWTGGADGTAKLWDLAKPGPKPKAILPARPTRIRGLALSADGTTLATTSDKDKTIQIWNVSEQPKLRGSVTVDTPAPGIAISPDGKLLAAGCLDGVVRAWSLREQIERSDDIRGGRGEIISIAFTPDGKSLMGLARWSDVEDRAFLWTLTGETKLEMKYNRHIQSAGLDAIGKHVVLVQEAIIFIVRLP